MKRHLPIRLLVSAAIAGSAIVTAAAAVPTGLASATTPAPLTVTCTTETGSETAIAVSNCTGTGAIVGEAGKTPTKGTGKVSNLNKPKAGDVTVSIAWAGGKTSVESDKETHVTTPATVAKDCTTRAGYTKLAYVTETGTVTSGSATKMVKGVVSGHSCAYSKSGKVYVFNQGALKI
jgi:hypothetical protein